MGRRGQTRRFESASDAHDRTFPKQRLHSGLVVGRHGQVQGRHPATTGARRERRALVAQTGAGVSRALPSRLVQRCQALVIDWKRMELTYRWV
jgi:hypothetical protein